MGKRFTETTKWADVWFRALNCKNKLGWQYLCDNCDVAGVIDVDRELGNFQIGDTLDWDALIEAAGERIVRLKSGKLWLSRFVKFQYGHDFPKKCQPHLSVLKTLYRYAESERVIQQFVKGLPTLKDKDKDKDKEQDKDSKNGSQRKRKSTAADTDPKFEEFWKRFPKGRKKSKGAARDAFRKAVLKLPADSLIAAAGAYAASPEGMGKFVKMPTTWLNQECWSDDPDAWKDLETAAPPKPKDYITIPFDEFKALKDAGKFMGRILQDQQDKSRYFGQLYEGARKVETYRTPAREV